LPPVKPWSLLSLLVSNESARREAPRALAGILLSPTTQQDPKERRVSGPVTPQLLRRGSGEGRVCALPSPPRELGRGPHGECLKRFKTKENAANILHVSFDILKEPFCLTLLSIHQD
jgi:hypothetical protein